MFPRSPGPGRGIITWAQRDSDVPTLSRALPWYHHVGTMNIRSLGPSLPELSTFPRSPGHGRGIITSARQDSILRDRAIENHRPNRSSEVPRRPNALSRANRGSITWAQRGSSLPDRGIRDSRRANAVQGMAVVSSRGHNEYPFTGTEHPEFSMFPRSPGHGRGIITWVQRDSDVPTLSRALPWYHHVGTMNVRS